MGFTPNITSFDQRQHNEIIKAIPSNSFDQRQNQTMQQNISPQQQVVSEKSEQKSNTQSNSTDNKKQ